VDDGWHCTQVGKITYLKKTPKLFKWSDAVRIVKALEPPQNFDILRAIQISMMIGLKLALGAFSVRRGELLERFSLRSWVFNLLNSIKQFFGKFDEPFEIVLLDYLGLEAEGRVPINGSDQGPV